MGDMDLDATSTTSSSSRRLLLFLLLPSSSFCSPPHPAPHEMKWMIYWFLSKTSVFWHENFSWNGLKTSFFRKTENAISESKSFLDQITSFYGKSPSVLCKRRRFMNWTKNIIFLILKWFFDTIDVPSWVKKVIFWTKRLHFFPGQYTSFFGSKL